jgi:hypothetical protein
MLRRYRYQGLIADASTSLSEAAALGLAISLELQRLTFVTKPHGLRQHHFFNVVVFGPMGTIAAAMPSLAIRGFSVSARQIPGQRNIQIANLTDEHATTASQ